MKFTYTVLNLAEYYRRDTTLQPSEISRGEMWRYIDASVLEALEVHASKSRRGIATLNTLSDYQVVVKAVK